MRFDRMADAKRRIDSGAYDSDAIADAVAQEVLHDAFTDGVSEYLAARDRASAGPEGGFPAIREGGDQ
ncbi:MAG: hypothetical protein ACKV2Q_36600 [Planctomycetaceae bacterium]